MKKFIMLVPMFLLFLSCSTKNKDTGYFVHLGKIYSHYYETEANRSDIYYLTKAPFILSRSYRLDDKTYFVSPSESKIYYFDPNTRSFTPVFEERFGNAFMTAHYIVTFSFELTRDETFEVKFYPFDNETSTAGTCQLSNVFVELFVSDSEVRGDALYVAGSDARDSKGYVYRFDPSRSEVVQVFETVKPYGEIRVTPAAGETFIYISSGSPQTPSRRYWSADLSGATVTAHDLETPQAFYGEGFIENGLLVLPVIQTDNTVIYESLSNGKVVRSTPSDYGNYRTVFTTNGYALLIGFNSFLTDKFALVELDLKNGQTANVVPIQ